MSIRSLTLLCLLRTAPVHCWLPQIGSRWTRRLPCKGRTWVPLPTPPSGGCVETSVWRTTRRCAPPWTTAPPCCRCSCSTRSLLRRRRNGPPGLVARRAARPGRRPAQRRAARVSASCAASPSNVVPRVAQAGRCRPGAHQRPTSARTGGAGTSGWRRPSPTPDVELIRTGSPYAVAPGTLINKSGAPVPGVHPVPSDLDRPRRARPRPGRPRLRCRLARRPRTGWTCRRPTTSWSAWPGSGRRGSSGGRGWPGTPRGSPPTPKLHDVPGADATSHLSIALRWGHLHPRTVLTDLAEQRSDGARGPGPPDRLAGLLRRRALAPAATRRRSRCGRSSEDGRGRAATRPRRPRHG